VSRALPAPQPWVIELVERGLEMLIILLVAALLILLLALVACILYVARRSERAVALVLLSLVLLDVASTYMLVQRYPVELELSPVLRWLLTIDKRLVFAWAPVEYAVLLGLFYLNKKVRERLGVRRRVELAIVALVAVAVASNVAGLLLAS
jgi:hypothetical protein